MTRGEVTSSNFAVIGSDFGQSYHINAYHRYQRNIPDSSQESIAGKIISQTAANLQSANEFNYLGVKYLDNKKFDEAIESFRKATLTEPKNAIFHNNLGNAYFNAQDYKKALVALQIATELEPSDAVFQYNLASTHSILGNHQEAFKALEKAIDLDPENTNYQDKLAIFNKKANAKNVIQSSYPKSKKDDDQGEIFDILRKTFLCLTAAVVISNIHRNFERRQQRRHVGHPNQDLDNPSTVVENPNMSFHPRQRSAEHSM